MAQIEKKCKNCRYRLDNRICSHPDSDYIGCVMSIHDWCREFAPDGKRIAMNTKGAFSIKQNPSRISSSPNAEMGVAHGSV